ncbi:exodeoxyribonuclease VII large subunit [Rhodothalassium salexigens]|uniref:exodeoxyribonuclease VII large subunit n=1 Tax=Rhodothalassium salexigens TaxID=1086 RepID=UPI001912ADA4|nr:exodeoxyribonuclease VII large subunit [Rhodothalassium salexigens]MBK5919886.1 exodeoxyribonuclease VII large subunit [Rhodothalassium salexigens]
MTLDNVQTLTVSELSASLKRTVEGEFGHVRVRGELSGVKRAASGHVYMALKDDRAVLDGVCWRGIAGRLRFKPEDGLEVIATGKLSTYPGRSKYQIIIDEMEPAGAGALMALLEERKKALAAEGLFAAERKRPLPYLPEVIGVITSPTGAVIRDILHRLQDRFPRRVLIWPVQVQGEAAAGQVAAAIHGFNALDGTGAVPRPDLLIVARGGGSIEDLWGFNEEIVVRAAADSAIPLISAVGHETDTTLIDYAADRRAPTPTAAAEMAVPVKAELDAALADRAARLVQARRRDLDRRAERLAHLGRALPRPRDLLGSARQRLDEAAGRLPRALRAVAGQRRGELNRAAGGLTLGRLRQGVRFKGERLGQTAARLAPAAHRRLGHDRDRLAASARLLTSLSHQGVLRRGYAILQAAGGTILRRRADLAPGQPVTALMQDGAAALTVTDGTAPGGDGPTAGSEPSPTPGSAAPKRATAKRPKTAKRQTGAGDGRQASLF